MRCDEARLAASLRFDGELSAGGGLDGLDVAALDEHIVRCPDCADFERHLQRVRTALRFEPVDAAPAVAPAVLQSLKISL